jgi:hypothetical protein
MMRPSTAVYAGHVVHQRVAPRRHRFRYRVFALALDVDEIDQTAAKLRLFSRNSANIVSFHDRDHGPGDGVAVGDHARRLLAGAGLAAAGARITLLCYPRILGYVFNPLSVYFCRCADDSIGAVIYEVTNTFRERVSYVIPVRASPGELLTHVCRKTIYVSPFTRAEGRYGFHVRMAESDVVIGVDFRDAQGPVLNTHFRGVRFELNDRTLAAMLARHPLMTFKVISAIHLEAARIWLKGVSPVRRHVSPAYSVALVAHDSPSRSGHGPQ